MKVVYRLFVNGVPKAQPRPRMTAKGHVYNPDSADGWKEEIKAAFLSCRKPVITGPVYLKVCFFLPMPKDMKKNSIGTNECVRHARKPDLDNLLKAVMDALTSVHVWKDDAQVYKTLAGKYYTGEKTGAQIIVETF